MDDELKELEAELQRLTPVAPSAVCAGRVRRALAPEAPRRSVARRLGGWWLALPAAALLALTFTTWEPSGSLPTAEKTVGAAPAPAGVATPAVAAFKPVAARNLLYAADDEGLVFLDDGTPAHRERLHFVDTITWRDPRTNASLQWSVPREEVRIVPVHYR